MMGEIELSEEFLSRIVPVCGTTVSVRLMTLPRVGYRKVSGTRGRKGLPWYPGEDLAVLFSRVGSRERERLKGLRGAPEGLGIDLAGRGLEVRKILFAGFGRQMAVWGYDPEDVLQEVYLGLMARNAGRCPWDGKKSSWGHYVHMVCSCILSNYSRKKRRIASVEQVGVLGVGGEDVEVGGVAVGGVESDVEVMTDLNVYLKASLNDPSAAVRVLPYVKAGYGKREMGVMGIPEDVVDRGVRDLREGVRDWAGISGDPRG